MKYDFDKVIDRTGTESLKWVYPRQVLKVEDAIPMWVADMDFEAPPAVVEAVRRRVEHGVFGYPETPPSFFSAAVDWLRRRHGWAVETGWLSMTPGIVPALNYCVRAFSRRGDPIKGGHNTIFRIVHIAFPFAPIWAHNPSPCAFRAVSGRKEFGK